MIISIFDKCNFILCKKELVGDHILSIRSNTLVSYEIEKITINDNMNIFDFSYFSGAKNILISEDPNYDLQIKSAVFNMEMYSKGVNCSKIIIKKPKVSYISIDKISLFDFMCEENKELSNKVEYATIEFNGNNDKWVNQTKDSNGLKLKIKKLFSVNNEEEIIDIVNENCNSIISKIIRIFDNMYIYCYKQGEGKDAYYDYDIYNNCISFVFIKSRLNSITITFNDRTDKFLDNVSVTSNSGDYESIKNIYYLLKMISGNNICRLSDNVSASIDKEELIIKILLDTN